MILFLIVVSMHAYAEPIIETTTIAVPSVSETNVTSTVAVSVVPEALALNKAKSTLVHEHNEKVVVPTSLYIEKEKPDPFVLIVDDEPTPEPTSGGTALYVEPENDVVVSGTKSFLCSDPEVTMSNTALCADGEGIIPEEKLPEEKKDNTGITKSEKDGASGNDVNKGDNLNTNEEPE